MTTQELVDAAVREFEGMRPLVSGIGDDKIKNTLQEILDMWWKEAAVYKPWLEKTLLSLATTVREGTKAECVACVPKAGDERYELAPSDRQIGYDTVLEALTSLQSKDAASTETV